MGVEHIPEDFRWTLGKMDANITLILRLLDEHKQERKELTSRVEKIETKINKAAGVILVFSAFISSAAMFIWKKVIG